jgi:hypothetical protein
VEHKQNILHQLQDYSATPPPGLFDKVWQTLQNSSLSDTMNNASIINTGDGHPPAELDFLRAVAVAPPAYMFSQVANVVLHPDNAIAAPPAKVVRKNFGWWKKAAAAAVLLLFGIAVVYQLMQNKTETDAVAILPSKTGNEAVTQPAMPATGSAGANLANDSNTQQSIVQKATTGQTTKKYREGRAKWQNQYSEKGQQSNALAFAGTDVLYKLVNYQYQDATAFMTALAASPQRRISIDRYSYVNVSEKMNGLLQRMYETKKNGKPTGKARRTKKRLEKWKKADAEYFDSKLSKNPLDIVDLSEFIFK